MLVRLYEEVINEEGKRSPGRFLGVIRFDGDGTPGEVMLNETCSEQWVVKDKSHPLYNKGLPIIDNIQKKFLLSLLIEPLFIATGGGVDKNGIHHFEGKSLLPWHKETVEIILEYEIPSMFGTICGKLVES